MAKRKRRTESKVVDLNVGDGSPEVGESPVDESVSSFRAAAGEAGGTDAPANPVVKKGRKTKADYDAEKKLEIDSAVAAALADLVVDSKELKDPEKPEVVPSAETVELKAEKTPRKSGSKSKKKNIKQKEESPPLFWHLMRNR